MSMSLAAQECISHAKAIGWDLNLDSIKALLQYLDNPQNKIKTIHVTGTNGKGSVCSFLRSILIKSGYRVGMYNSPAVECDFERYTINGKWITEDDYNSLMDTIAMACRIVELQGFRHPSLFEIETALAFLYFVMSKCEINIIEVGMGGALDATNVIDNPLICVFTSIGMDHSNFLGSTLSDISKNKAGIIRDNSTIVSAIQEDEVRCILSDCAKAHMADIYYALPVPNNTSLGLMGEFQYQNAGVAKECAYILRNMGYKITEQSIVEGLKSAVWPFRFETINSDPLIILDGAHNYPAIVMLKKTIQNELSNRKLTFVISVLKDKDFDEMFSLILPLAENVIVVQSDSDRALDIDNLYDCVANYSSKAYKASNFYDAAQKAINYNNDAIICFGSFTYLNKIKKSFKEIL